MSFIEVETTEQDASGEQSLQEAKKVMAGTVPLIRESESPIIELPRGRFTGGKWETEAEVRELTGADEEALARFKDPVDFFDGVLVYGTARIGSTNLTGMSFPERQEILVQLLVGEREQLFMHITRVTYGNDKLITHNCPSCSMELETTLLISEDIKFPTMENPHSMSETMVTSKGHVLTYRLATGSDQLSVLKRKGASIAEQNTLMISECVMEVDGKQIVDRMANARNLSMGDRRKLLDLLTEKQPSPNLNVITPCSSCGFEMVIPLTWGDIFRP